MDSTKLRVGSTIRSSSKREGPPAGLRLMGMLKDGIDGGSAGPAGVVFGILGASQWKGSLSTV